MPTTIKFKVQRQSKYFTYSHVNYKFDGSQWYMENHYVIKSQNKNVPIWMRCAEPPEHNRPAWLVKKIEKMKDGF